MNLKIGIVSLLCVSLLNACGKQEPTSIDSALFEPSNNKGEVSGKTSPAEDLLLVAEQLQMDNLALASPETPSESLPQITVGASEYSDGNILFNLSAEVSATEASNLVTRWVQPKGSSAFILSPESIKTQVLLPRVEKPENVRFRLFAVDVDTNIAVYKDFVITVLPVLSDFSIASKVVNVNDGSVSFVLGSKLPLSESVLFQYFIVPANPNSMADFSDLQGSIEFPAGSTDTTVNIPLTPELITQSTGAFKIIMFGTFQNLPVQVQAFGIVENVDASNKFSLQGVSPTEFNQVGDSIELVIKNAEFSLDTSSMVATINETAIAAENIALTPSSIVIQNALVDGKNTFTFQHMDSTGTALEFQAELWAGSHTLEVTLIDEAGNLITEPTHVTLSLIDNGEVTQVLEASSATLSFEYLPQRTLFVEAATLDGLRTGTASALGNQGSLEVTLEGFGTVSEVDNNDFSLGLDGWQTGNPSAASTVINPETGDYDLVLMTMGEGKQSITRTFQTKENVVAVRVRFRFVTLEVPNNFFGSEYNDTYSVSLRTRSGEPITEASSMNGLGLEAFDQQTGETGWREVLIPVDPAGEQIQVWLTVSNVGDGAFDSRVIVDFVEEVFVVE